MDLVVAVNGQPVSGMADLHRFLTEWPIGKALRLTLIRGKDLLELTVRPSEADSVEH